jgi:iron(III) transport system ATP-binding protein
MTSLTVRGLTKSYGRTAVLHGIDLQVPNGSFTAVLGPSGCGKTTLLRLVAGFVDPDGGTIAFGDDVVAGPTQRVPPERRRVGYVPQEGALFPHMTAAANITFGLPRSRRQSRDRVAELLDLVGLDHAVAERYPHQLSGGQQQRIALARALAPAPAMVLLDEPFSSLDAALREGTRQGVLRALRASRATAVLVTHDQDEALSMADQVAVMRDGRLVQSDIPSALYEHPADADVAQFLGDAVILRAVVSGGRAMSVLGSIPVTGSRADGPTQILVRPEQIKLRSDVPRSAHDVVAEVLEVYYYGHDASVRARIADSGEVILSRTLGAGRPTPGEVVTVQVAGPATVLPTAPATS